MERNKINVTEISPVEDLTKFIETGLGINSGREEDEDISKIETCEKSDESSDAFSCVNSDYKMEEYCTPVEEIFSISKKKLDISRKKLHMETMNSKRINEALLKAYISKIFPQVKSADSKKLKAKKPLDSAKNGTKLSGDMFGLNDSGLKIVRPPTIDLDQDDLQKFLSPKPNQVDDSSSEDCLMLNSSPLPEAFNGVVQKLKEIVQKIEELLDSMDSRPHWNRLVGKSNSPWKLNHPIADDSDKKPKILKHWTDTRLKFSRLSASLKELIYTGLSSSEIKTFLADVKGTILQCVDFDKMQDCSNLTENIQTAFDADSDIRYVFNLERRILTIEVTLKNITFEIDRIQEDYEKEKKFQTNENIKRE